MWKHCKRTESLYETNILVKNRCGTYLHLLFHDPLLINLYMRNDIRIIKQTSKKSSETHQILSTMATGFVL